MPTVSSVALADFLEEGEADVAVLDGNVAGAEQRPGTAGPVDGAQARGEEAQRPMDALEVRDGDPTLAHQVDQRRVEGVGRHGRSRKARPSSSTCAPHLREHPAISVRRRCNGARIRRSGEQPALDAL